MYQEKKADVLRCDRLHVVPKARTELMVLRKTINGDAEIESGPRLILP